MAGVLVERRGGRCSHSVADQTVEARQAVLFRVNEHAHSLGKQLEVGATGRQLGQQVTPACAYSRSLMLAVAVRGSVPRGLLCSARIRRAGACWLVCWMAVPRYVLQVLLSAARGCKGLDGMQREAQVAVRGHWVTAGGDWGTAQAFIETKRLSIDSAGRVKPLQVLPTAGRGSSQLSLRRAEPVSACRADGAVVDVCLLV